MKKNRTIINKDFNYFPLVFTLWREKFLILIFSLLGLSFSYYSFSDRDTFNKAMITINSPPKICF